MTLNGVGLAVDTATVDTVAFQGGGGNDNASLTGRAVPAATPCRCPPAAAP